MGLATDSVNGGQQGMKIALVGYGKMGKAIEEIALQRGHEIVLKIDVDNADDLHAGNIEGVDVAMRFGTLTNSNATARLLDASPRLLLASPDYLRPAGTPRKPADLADLSVIVGPARSGPIVWSFEQQGRRTSVRIDGRLTISSNEGAVAAAIAGLGIVSTVVWGCRTDLENGNLVHVLTDWNTELVELHAVFPAGRAAKAAARTFADYLARVLGQWRQKAVRNSVGRESRAATERRRKRQSRR